MHTADDDGMQIDHDRSVINNRTQGLIDERRMLRRKTQDPLLGCIEQDDQTNATPFTLSVGCRLLSINQSYL